MSDTEGATAAPDELYSLQISSMERLHLADESEVSLIGDLPWEDIVYRCVFPCLSLTQLFTLRAASRLCQRCVAGYFAKMRRLSLTNLGPRFNLEALRIVTDENRVLKTLIVRKANDWLKEEMLLPIIERSSRLEHVDLSQSTALGNTVICRLAVVAGKRLRELVLRECRWLGEEALLQVSVNCPNLEHLDISGCWEVQDNAITNIAMLCQRIEFLSVAKLYGLTDVSVCQVAKSLRGLRHVNLTGCWRLSDRSVFMLAEYCKQLCVLQVRECRDVTAACLQNIASKRQHIRIDILPASKPKLTQAHYDYMKGLPM